MKTSWAVVGLFLIFAACSPNSTERQKGTGDRRFRTTPPSLLYFKNMRSIQYTVEEQPKSRIELYRLNKYEEVRQRPVLYPLIANNWLEDEAYLFLQPNDWADGFLSPLTLSQDTAWSAPILQLQPPTPGEQYALGMQLYESLKRGEGWYVAAADSTFAPIFDDGDERAYFLTTVQDYLKLTDKD
ncbi:MAG: hypothetical protein RIC19_09105 [Phaeodactylibacter sp.]|uniref:hypothetical protein n=1 Tax=Phaeodactylibacter sp. TaxID=1940289 RepID=UPI0032ECC95C